MPEVAYEGFPPIPPPELIQRVIGSFPADQAEAAQRSFHLHAERSLAVVEQGLASVGRRVTDFERLLDFGCGPGRLLRWLDRYADDVELHGTDIDPDAIEWCQGNLPFGQFTVAPHEPPTTYPDRHFDLVVNHSVFTHLDERMQDLWLAELRRITRPGAILLLTVHSAKQAQTAFEQLAATGVDAARYRRRLEQEGILFFETDDYIGSGFPAFYRSTLHAPWYVFEHWNRFFTVRGYMNEGSDTQDLVVLERRADTDPVPVPVGHGAAAGGADGAPAGQDEVTAALAYLSDVHAQRPPARTALGRIKRRALRGETDRTERMFTALLVTMQALGRSQQGLDDLRRDVGVLHAALEKQGTRTSLLARELRSHER